MNEFLILLAIISSNSSGNSKQRGQFLQGKTQRPLQNSELPLCLKCWCCITQLIGSLHLHNEVYTGADSLPEPIPLPASSIDGEFLDSMILHIHTYLLNIWIFYDVIYRISSGNIDWWHKVTMTTKAIISFLLFMLMPAYKLWSLQFLCGIFADIWALRSFSPQCTKCKGF